ncbi:chondroitin 4-sulfotransferase [Aureococcus anophagefferens]|nr:chondroitin 4-sulfotransferase [Aureococcus anophagefferens]
MPSIRLLAAALASARANYTLPRLHPRAPLSYREQELRYAQHHMYVDVKHKLLYCAVPKVACTEFMRLFFRLKGENQNQRWKGDPHFRQDKPLFNKIMNVTTATALMNDPTWTKFAFWRDPAERLLSAYLDKFANGEALLDGRFMCNMEKFLPAYNFVGSFDHLGDHAEKLLRALGLWEAYGAAGWTKALKRTVVDKIKGAVGGGDDGGRMFQKNAAWHQTTKMKPENHDLYTPELLAKVRRAYAMDYEMFDAVGFGGDEPASGANWGDAKYAGRQTMGGFDRAFKDDHGVRAWS